MKQIKLFSALLLCMFALSLPAYCGDEIKYFVLWHSDGSSTALALEEHPLIKVDAANKQLVCCTDTREITLVMDDVSRYSFEETADVTSVNELPATAASFGKCGETIMLNNFAAGTKVNIYTSGGILNESHTTDLSGSLIIDTQSWSKGLYIIKAEEITYKILIK